MLGIDSYSELDVRIRKSTAVVHLKCTCKKMKNSGLVILGKNINILLTVLNRYLLMETSVRVQRKKAPPPEELCV